MSRLLRSGPGGILSYFTRHATAANLLLLVLIVLGLLALPRMRTQFFPDVVVETISVSVEWSGAGPEDVDNAIVQILEPALLAVEGVASSSASSTEGRAQIRLEFDPGWDTDRALGDIQTVVDGISGLPEEAEDPQVRQGVWRDPVTDVIITGPVAVDLLARYADEFVAKLFVEGVTRASIRGISAPSTVIEVTEAKLVQYDVTIAEIAAAIAEEAQADPAGDVAGGTSRVRTGVAKRDADQLAEVVIRSNPDGSKLRVADVATIRVEDVDRARAYFVGSDPAISIGVERSQSGDAVGIQKTVRSLADEMVTTLPEGVKIDLIRTRAEAITSRLDLLVTNGLTGLALVVLLLVFFLNTRTALWVAAGIPVAMLTAIVFMYAAGLTLNMISLFALIICLGIVVDDAIVVGEHADFRARRLGESAVEAAENAARRMWLPVFSATVTTVIAFFALVAIGGRFGGLIQDIPFTVIVVLLASLTECFLILPNHMRHSLKHVGARHWYDFPSRIFNVFFTWFREALFRRFVKLVIWMRYPVVAGAMLLLASQVVLVLSGQVQWRFFDSPEQGQISGNFAMVNGATRADTFEMMLALQHATEKTAADLEAEHGTNPVTYVLTEIGGGSGRGLAAAGSKDADLLGSISIELINADLRPYSSFAFLAQLQANVENHPLLETLNFRSFRGGPGGDSLDVQLIGQDAQTLKDAAEALKTAVSVYPEVSAVEDNLAYDKEEIVLELTAQGRALGFTIDSLGRVLRNRLGGVTAASYPVGTRSADIRVELPADTLTADYLERTMMRTPAGNYVPLADIVTVQTRLGFSTVLRENGQRLISVTGDISEDDPARATEITETIRDVILPDIQSRFGVNWRVAGLAEQENRFLSDARTGFILCLTGIFLTLAWVFSSWTRPIIVMAIIPFGLIGTIFGHYIWGVPLSMFTVVGLIGMTGIIINDSIVLVSTIDEYAEERGLIPAIIDGTVDRLRPVLLTSLTTVFGLAPLLYETSQDAQFLKPTVITLCYGLGFGVVLVLLIVPSFLAMQADVARRVASFRRAFGVRQQAWGVWVLSGVSALAVLAVLAATLGYQAVTGTVLPLVSQMPAAGNFPIAIQPAVVFVMALSLICLIGFSIGAIGMRFRRR